MFSRLTAFVFAIFNVVLFRFGDADFVASFSQLAWNGKDIFANCRWFFKRYKIVKKPKNIMILGTSCFFSFVLCSFMVDLPSCFTTT